MSFVDFEKSELCVAVSRYAESAMASYDESHDVHHLWRVWRFAKSILEASGNTDIIEWQSMRENTACSLIISLEFSLFLWNSHYFSRVCLCDVA